MWSPNHTLQAHGADANMVGEDSFGPIHICSRRGDSKSLDILLDANTSINLKTRDGQTALDIAKAKVMRFSSFVCVYPEVEIPTLLH